MVGNYYFLKLYDYQLEAKFILNFIPRFVSLVRLLIITSEAFLLLLVFNKKNRRPLEEFLTKYKKKVRKGNTKI